MKMITKTRLRGWQELLALGLLLSAPLVMAVQPQNTPAQFDMTGIIDTFTLNPSATCPTPSSAITTPNLYNAQVGGAGNRTAMDCTATITINGQNILLPANTVVTLPASFLTPYELFAYNPLCTGICSASGLAQNDPAGLRLPGSFEASIQGNITYPGGVPTMIAGLVKITQEDLNTGDGFITSINYATGELMVGGNIGVVPADGVRVRINDPVGRFGRPTVPSGPLDTFDPRFAVDDGNPTISAETGYPMCLPAVILDPATNPGVDDPLCPQANRGGAAPNAVSPNGTPIHLANFTTDCMPGLKVGGACPPIAGGLNSAQPSILPGTNPNLAAPLEVGDFIHYKGNLETDASGTYIAAHTISANVGIYTYPGQDPAYMTQETTIVGLGPTTGFTGLQEGRELFKVVGFTTDTNRIIDISKVVTDPCDGTETPALIASQWPNGATSPAAPSNFAANVPLGRFRTQFLKGANLGVSMIPATKEIRTQIRGSNPVVPPALPRTQGNGLVYGQYQAPVGEYIFPENLGFGGLPIVPNNMENLQFLALGHGPWNLYDPYANVFSAGLVDPAPIQSQLAPWPGAAAPAGVPLASCLGVGGAVRPAPPVVNILPATVTIARAGAVTLVASATTLNGSNNISFAWNQVPGDAFDVTGTAVVTNNPAPVNPANPWTSSFAFAAPGAATTLHLTVTVTDNNTGESSAATPVTVNVVAAVDRITPTINPPQYKSKDGSWNFGFTSDDATLTWQPTVQIFNGSNVLVKTFIASELTRTPLSNVYSYTNKLLVGPLGNIPPALPVGMTMVVISDKGGRLGPINIQQK